MVDDLDILLNDPSRWRRCKNSLCLACEVELYRFCRGAHFEPVIVKLPPAERPPAVERPPSPPTPDLLAIEQWAEIQFEVLPRLREGRQRHLAARAIGE